jgi:hypothetical protein
LDDADGGRITRATEDGRDYLAVFEREDDVAPISPDFEVLKELDSQGEL